ncbi:hypothetical protein [Glutamicibacter sp. NPDC087583]|uniref:phage tail termination protein n=1 Tax=Glutamicibacter sp. NPDC087583 TaxID=3363995 RepID=UPI00380C2B44
MAVRFHDAESLVQEHLAAELPGVHVADAPPKESTTGQFIKILRTGGSRMGRVVDQPILVVEAYADTPSAAWDLAEDARQSLEGMKAAFRVNPRVYKVAEVSGPANLPDPAHAGLSRYTQTIQLSIRYQAGATP